MSADFITRNLRDQSGNFGTESVLRSVNGTNQFVDARTGDVQRRSISPESFGLENTPLDNSFQLNPQGFNVAKALFEQPGVPTNLSNTYGAIVAVTAKEQGVGANQLFNNGVMSAPLLENVNFFRTAHSQIGVNTGSAAPPYLFNIVLGAKIINQTG
jgi:hypothetical protein